jgi:hypothetical protein
LRLGSNQRCVAFFEVNTLVLEFIKKNKAQKIHDVSNVENTLKISYYCDVINPLATKRNLDINTFIQTVVKPKRKI